MTQKKNTDRYAHKLADATHAKAARFLRESSETAKTDCKAGCSYCCHQPATAFAFEAIRIAEALKKSRSAAKLESLKAKMSARVKGFKDSSVSKNINNKTACPLLSENQCSVYEDRPLTCRLAHSFSVKRCRLAFEKDRMKVQIPVSGELIEGISALIEEAYEELPRQNLDGNLYELNSAVLAALADPEAALKWANGDLSVFKDCIIDDTAS